MQIEPVDIALYIRQTFEQESLQGKLQISEPAQG